MDQEGRIPKERKKSLAVNSFFVFFFFKQGYTDELLLALKLKGESMESQLVSAVHVPHCRDNSVNSASDTMWMTCCVCSIPLQGQLSKFCISLLDTMWMTWESSATQNHSNVMNSYWSTLTLAQNTVLTRHMYSSQEQPDSLRRLSTVLAAQRLSGEISLYTSFILYFTLSHFSISVPPQPPTSNWHKISWINCLFFLFLCCT